MTENITKRLALYLPSQTRCLLDAMEPAFESPSFRSSSEPSAGATSNTTPEYEYDDGATRGPEASAVESVTMDSLISS